MTIETTDLGSNSTMIVYSYDTTHIELLTAIQMWIVSHGWTLHDFQDGVNPFRVFKSPTKDGTAFKYVLVQAGYIPNTLCFTVYENWNATSNSPTNMAINIISGGSAFEGPVVSLGGGSAIGGVLYLFATARYLAMWGRYSNAVWPTGHVTGWKTSVGTLRANWSNGDPTGWGVNGNPGTHYSLGIIGCFEVANDDGRLSSDGTACVMIQGETFRNPYNHERTQQYLTHDPDVISYLHSHNNWYSYTDAQANAWLQNYFVGFKQLSCPRTSLGSTSVTTYNNLMAVLPEHEIPIPRWTELYEGSRQEFEGNAPSSGFYYDSPTNWFNSNKIDRPLDLSQRSHEPISAVGPNGNYLAFTPNLIEFDTVSKLLLHDTSEQSLFASYLTYSPKCTIKTYSIEQTMLVKKYYGRIYGIKVADTSIDFNPMDTCTLKVDSEQFPATNGTDATHYLTGYSILLPA